MFARLLQALSGALSSSSGRNASLRKKVRERLRRTRRLTLLGLEERRLMAAGDFIDYENESLGDPQVSNQLRPDIASVGDNIVSVHTSTDTSFISYNNGVDWETFDPDPEPRVFVPRDPPDPAADLIDPRNWGPFTGRQQVVSDRHRGMLIRTMEYAPGGDPQKSETFTNGVRLAYARNEAELLNQQWNYHEFSSLGLGLPRGVVVENVRMEIADNFVYFLADGNQLQPIDDPPTVFERKFVASVWWRVSLEQLFFTNQVEVGVTHVYDGFRMAMTSGAKDVMYAAVLAPPGTISTLRVYSWRDTDLGPFERDFNNIPAAGLPLGEGDTGTAVINTGWVGRGRVGFMWDAPRRPSTGRPFEFVRTVVFKEPSILDPLYDVNPPDGIPDNPVDSQPDLFSTSAVLRAPVAQATPRGDVAISVTRTSASDTKAAPLRTAVYIDDSESRGNDLVQTPIRFRENILAPDGASGLLGDITPMGLAIDDIYTDTFLATTYKYIGGAQRQANNHFYWLGREDEDREPGPNLRGEFFDILQDGAAPGSPVDVEFTVRNTGLKSAAAYKVSFYASTDRRIDTSDTLISTNGFGSLARVTSRTNTVTLTLPAASDPLWSAVQNGELYVGMIVDSANAVAEGSETDNRNRGFGIDSGALLGASFGASNNSLATAIDLGIISGRRTYSQLSIAPVADQDFFTFTAPANGTFEAKIEFQHADGNLDLFAFNSAGVQIGSSSTSPNANPPSVPRDSETLRFNVVRNQTYSIRVAGATNAVRNAYSLVTDFRLPDDPSEDPPGPNTRNDTLSTPTDLGKIDFYSLDNATISSFNERDYYRFQGNRNGTFTITNRFTRANGDLRMLLLDARGNTLATGVDGVNRETIRFNVRANHVYYVQIDGNLRDTNTYDLSMLGVLPPVAISGNNAIVTGSTQNDIFEFRSLATPTTHVFSVNGVNFNVPANVVNYQINGDTGSDTFIVNGTAAADTINVSAGLVTLNAGTLAYQFTQASIEQVTALGAAGDDTLTVAGNIPANLFGDDGDDLLFGGGGNDVLSGGAGFDFLDGSTGNDRLFGGNDGDVLTDSEGSDLLVGGSGDDQYIFENAIASQTDTIEELAAIGTDDLDFSFSTNPVVLDLLATTRQIGTHGLRRIQVNVIGQGANFENLYGGRGNDRLSGNNKANIIVGGVGSDILQGAGGNDMYLFDDPTGTENDQIGETAGGGIDLLDFSRSSVDIVANMSSNVAFVKQGNRTVRTVNNSAQQFEAFFGGFGDDTIRGNNANNFLDGRSGSDTLRGSRGDDVYNYSFLDGVEVIQELPNEGSDTITFATATQALRIDLSAPLVIGSMGFGGLNAPAGSGLHIENVIGTDNDDLIIGSDANNNIAGGAGRDFIISGRGRDQIFGGEGDDLLIAGTTLNLDSNAILAIFDEWLSSRGYGTRVSNIRGPNGGDNGSSFLTIRTVTDDNQTDVLAGEGGEDWFWVGVGDTSDRVVGESQN